MKKAFLSLLAVGLLVLTGCDTGTSSVSESTDSSSSSSSPIEETTSTSSVESSSSVLTEEQLAEQLRTTIWTQLGYAGYTGNYTVVSSDGAGGTYIEQLAIDEGYYYVPTEGAGYKQQASVVGDGDLVYYFEEQADGTFVIQSPFYSSGSLVTNLDSLVNYLSFAVDGTVTISALEIDGSTIYTTDSTFITSLFGSSATSAIARLDLDYADYTITIAPELVDGYLGEEATEEDIEAYEAELTLQITDILDTSVDGLSDDLEIGPAAIAEEDFTDFSSQYGSIYWEGYIYDYYDSSDSGTLDVAATINYGNNSYSSEFWFDGGGFTGEYYFDDGDGLMVEYIDAGTGEAAVDSSYAEAGYTWDILSGVSKAQLNNEAFRYYEDLSIYSGLDVYEYWGTDAADWIYSLMMYNLGVSISSVYAIVNSGTTYLQVTTNPFYYSSNPNDVYQYVFLISASALEGDTVPQLATTDNGFDAAYVDGKLDGTGDYAVQVSGWNNLWSSVFTGLSNSAATTTLTTNLLEVDSPFYSEDYGYYLAEDGIYYYEETSAGVSVQLVISSTTPALWSYLVNGFLFPFSGNALSQDPSDSSLWWAAANSSGFSYYLYYYDFDVTYYYTYLGYSFYNEDSSFCVTVDEDNGQISQFNYTAYNGSYNSFDAEFTYSYDSATDSSIADSTSDLEAAIKAAIEDLNNTEEGGEGFEEEGE